MGFILCQRLSLAKGFFFPKVVGEVKKEMILERLLCFLWRKWLEWWRGAWCLVGEKTREREGESVELVWVSDDDVLAPR